MTILIDKATLESLELELKYSECTTINELIAKRITKEVTKHDLEYISYIDLQNDCLRIEI